MLYRVVLKVRDVFCTLIMIHTTYNTGTSTYPIYNSNTKESVNETIVCKHLNERH